MNDTLFFLMINAVHITVGTKKRKKKCLLKACSTSKNPLITQMIHGFCLVFLKYRGDLIGIKVLKPFITVSGNFMVEFCFVDAYSPALAYANTKSNDLVFKGRELLIDMLHL